MYHNMDTGELLTIHKMHQSESDDGISHTGRGLMVSFEAVHVHEGGSPASRK